MYEIVILGKDQNATWKIGKKPDDLTVYLKPGVFMVALYTPSYEGGLGGDHDAELIDYIYRGGNTSNDYS